MCFPREKQQLLKGSYLSWTRTEIVVQTCRARSQTMPAFNLQGLTLKVSSPRAEIVSVGAENTAASLSGHVLVSELCEGSRGCCLLWFVLISRSSFGLWRLNACSMPQYGSLLGSLGFQTLLHCIASNLRYSHSTSKPTRSHILHLQMNILSNFLLSCVFHKNGAQVLILHNRSCCQQQANRELRKQKSCYVQPL